MRDFYEYSRDPIKIKRIDWFINLLNNGTWFWFYWCFNGEIFEEVLWIFKLPDDREVSKYLGAW